MTAYAVTLDTGEALTVTPRPVDQFGYLRWAVPALGVDSIGEDTVAFGTYGVARAMLRDGTLAEGDDLMAAMTRITSLTVAEVTPDPTQPEA